MTDLASTLRDALAGRYTVEREIGRGGMASVYLAHDVRHDRPVALKVLHPELALAVGADRFLREIQVVARLRHPHIVPLYDSGEVRGGPSGRGDAPSLLYYVMPYIRGESLRERLRRGGAIPPADALRIVREVADALDYAHGEGVIHRDIKPDNIMLDDRHALVADFGIARALSATSDATLTGTGIFIGTPAYMSPEQVTGERELDGRSDLYSLGCVLYELLTGDAPFAGPTPQAVMAKRFATPAPSLDAVRAVAPAAVERIVTTALRPEPNERFASARDMCDALDAAATGLHDGGSPVPAAVAPAGLAPAGVDSPRPGHRRRTAWLAGAGAVAVLATIYSIGLRPGGRPRMATPAAGAAANGSAPSVGVLPFANRSDSREMEYFSDGVTDELITALSRVEGLQVAGRASSFSLQGKNLDAREAAQRLQVRYVIDGSVRHNGNEVRVTWELLDGGTGRVAGSGEFDGEMRNVISLQDSLARQIVERLRPALGGAAPVAVRTHQTTDFEAYDLYLKGHYYWNQRTPGTLRQGIAYLQQAIAKDSSYALAWAELSSAYTLEPGFGDMRPEEVQEPARRAARRAVALDSTLSEAYTALGMNSTFNDHDWPGALAYLDKAVALDPKNSFPRLFRAWPLVILGRFDDAVAELHRARDLDPLSAIINTRLASALTYARRFDEATTELRKVLALDPSNVLARFELGKSLAFTGHFDEAFKEFPDAIDAEAGYCMGWVAIAYGLAGRPNDARTIYRRLDARSRQRYIDPLALVLAAIGAGNHADALDWLDRALRENAFYLFLLGRDAIFDGLRDEPRFKEVLRTLKL